MRQGPPRATFRIEAAEDAPENPGETGGAAQGARPPPTDRDPTARTLDDLPLEWAGRYAVDGLPEVIGIGGIGRVVVVEDTTLGREVALKELLPHRAGVTASASDVEDSHQSRPTSTHTARFLREAQITARLEHPSIVPVYELGRRPDGTLYYTMRRIRGRTLARAFDEAASLQDRLRLLGHVVDACYALAYAHSRGVVHRDLKPDNVMVGEFGETVVLDWGLAAQKGDRDHRARHIAREIERLEAAHSRHTLAGTVMGTPAYMSPEQAQGHIELLDERADVWSLGAVLYELLAGAPPYDGTNPHEVLRRVRHDPLPRLARRAPGAPPELVAIAEKALSRDRAGRYPTAAAMAEDIEAWRTGRRVGAYTYSPIENLRRFYAANRVALTIGGAAIVGMLGVAGSYHAQVAEERDRARAAEAAASQRAEEARRGLADSLAEHADAAWSEQDPLRAEVYAAGALAVREDPSSRGLLLASTHAPRPVVAATLPGSGGCAPLAWGPDRRSFTCATANALLQWDLAALAEPRRRAAAGVRALAYSADGLTLYGLSTTGELTAWDAATLEARWERSHPQLEALTLAPSPDGAWVAVGGKPSGGTSTYLQVYAADGSARSSWSGSRHDYATGLAWSADGTTLSAAGWGIETRDLDGTLLHHGARHDAALAVSQHGSETAVAWQDQKVTVGDGVLPLPGVFTRTLAWSAGGDRLVTSSTDGAVRVWTRGPGGWQEPVEEARLVGPSAGAPSVAVAPEGTGLATSSGAGPVRIWNLDTIADRAPELPRTAYWVAPDARYVAWLGDGLASFADPATGRVVRQVPVPPLASPFLTWAQGGAAAWGVLTTGETLLVRPDLGTPLVLPPGEPEAAQVRAVAGTGAGLAVLREDGTIEAFGPDGHPAWRVRLADLAGAPSLAWSADGTRLHVATPPARFLTLDGDTGNVVETTTVLPFADLWAAWTLDGTRVAVATTDHRVRVLEAGTWRELAELVGHTSPTWGGVFDETGARILTIGGDETARLWDVASARELAMVGRRGSFVWQGGFAPDGTTLYTAGNEPRLRAWDLGLLDRPGAELLDDLERRYGLRLDGTRIRVGG